MAVALVELFGYGGSFRRSILLMRRIKMTASATPVMFRRQWEGRGGEGGEDMTRRRILLTISYPSRTIASPPLPTLKSYNMARGISIQSTDTIYDNITHNISH